MPARGQPAALDQANPVGTGIPLPFNACRRRTLLAGTSPCLHYSEFHGAERYNSGSSQRASAGVSSRGQTWLSNPSLCAGGQKPSDPYISRPDIAVILLPSAFFRVSSRFAAPSRQVITPAASLPFPPAQAKSLCPVARLHVGLCSTPDAPAPPSGEPLRPLTAGQSENGAPCGNRTRDLAVIALRGLLFAPGDLRERLPWSGTEPRQRGHEHALPAELTVRQIAPRVP